MVHATQDCQNIRSSRCIAWFILGIAATALAACGPAQVKTKPPVRAGTTWTTQIYADHPLVGKVWSSNEARFIDQAEFVNTLRKATLLLIGERHDNPDHHRLQGQILLNLPAGARVGFEMLDHDDADALAKATTPETVQTLTAWDKSGWPKFEIYAPVFEAVFAQKHTPLAVHPRRVEIRKSMMGPTSQSHGDGTYDGPLSPQGQAALRKDIAISHCGHASPNLVNAMMVAQEFKDRTMTNTLMAVPGDGQRVLIAGNGHVRKDYGVPNHLKSPVVSVGLIEVTEKATKASEYNPERYDYLWFTPRLDTLNPCDKYRKVLEAMKRRYQKKHRGTHKKGGSEPVKAP